VLQPKDTLFSHRKGAVGPAQLLPHHPGHDRCRTPVAPAGRETHGSVAAAAGRSSVRQAATGRINDDNLRPDDKGTGNHGALGGQAEARSGAIRAGDISPRHGATRLSAILGAAAAQSLAAEAQPAANLDLTTTLAATVTTTAVSSRHLHGNLEPIFPGQRARLLLAVWFLWSNSAAVFEGEALAAFLFQAALDGFVEDLDELAPVGNVNKFVGASSLPAGGVDAQELGFFTVSGEQFLPVDHLAELR
jgi:hypothetical protein